MSQSLIYTWCQEGRLPHLRLGGRGRRGKILILDSDLDAFLDGCKVTEPPDEDGPLKHIQ